MFSVNFSIMSTSFVQEIYCMLIMYFFQSFFSPFDYLISNLYSLKVFSEFIHYVNLFHPRDFCLLIIYFFSVDVKWKTVIFVFLGLCSPSTSPWLSWSPPTYSLYISYPKRYILELKSFVNTLDMTVWNYEISVIWWILYYFGYVHLIIHFLTITLLSQIEINFSIIL